MPVADEATEVRRLDPWLQDIRLPSGLRTAPEHPLGDWPQKLWEGFRDDVPADLSGRRVLDIGCNAGFYCLEMARRGAEVVGLEPNPRYRAQADLVARAWGLRDRIELRDGQVYGLGRSEERFDVVLFLGVFYHLRYPLLALDAVRRVCTGSMYFQSLTTPGNGDLERPVAKGDELARLEDPGWPKMAFIEDQLLGDPTNRWVPNPEGVRSMLRNAGFAIRSSHGPVHACTTVPVPTDWQEAEFQAAMGRDWQVGEHVYAPRPGTLESRAAAAGAARS